MREAILWLLTVVSISFLIVWAFLPENQQRFDRTKADIICAEGSVTNCTEHR